MDNNKFKKIEKEMISQERREKVMDYLYDKFSDEALKEARELWRKFPLWNRPAPGWVGNKKDELIQKKVDKALGRKEQ